MHTNLLATELRHSLLMAAVCAIAQTLTERQKREVHESLVMWGCSVPPGRVPEGVDAAIAGDVALLLRNIHLESAQAQRPATSERAIVARIAYSPACAERPKLPLRRRLLRAG